jgi:hypothetical protein
VGIGENQETFKTLIKNTNDSQVHALLISSNLEFFLIEMNQIGDIHRTILGNKKEVSTADGTRYLHEFVFESQFEKRKQRNHL